MALLKHRNHSHIFVCPNDGPLIYDDVVFLCNKCARDEVKQVEEAID